MRSPTLMDRLESREHLIITLLSLTFLITLQSEWPIMTASKKYKFQRKMLSEFQEVEYSLPIASIIPKPKIEMLSQAMDMVHIK